MNTEEYYLLSGQLASQADTTKDTIRHYDQLGLLKSRKRQAGSRYYTEYHPECVDRIKLIKAAQAIGFKLTEIKNSLNDYYDGNLDIDEQILAISEKLEQARRQQLNLMAIIDQLNERLQILKQMKRDNHQPLPRGDYQSSSDNQTTPKS